ncbi:MAG: tryptophan synthase subunit alpha [Chitinophagaceae bacterium]
MKRKANIVTAEEKVTLYHLAIQLFENGQSHPQIVEVLNKSIDDNAAIIITDKAFKNEWNKLHEKAARLLIKKRLWHDVVEELSKNEPYRDVVEYLVSDIYSREVDILHAGDVFKKKFEIWGYLLIMGIIQLIRYLISPYNKYYFWISMLIGAVGLCWGIWDFFLNKKDHNVFRRFVEFKKFEHSMNNQGRIEILFREKQQRVLNVYYTAGYPHLDSTLRIMRALQDNGADIIELGMPYSDPLADGPVIQHSSSIALANGMTIKKLFEQLQDFRSKINIPVILMGYMNPVLQYGFEKFCADAAAAGIDGLILPDLPEYEFETEYGAIIKKYGLDFIFLVTPETAVARIKKLDELSTGFLYAVSSSSTTGSDKNMTDVNNYLEKLKNLNLRNSILVGFGIKDKKTFEAACRYANGAIIGTAFVKALEGSKNEEHSVKQFLKSVI